MSLQVALDTHVAIKIVVVSSGVFTEAAPTYAVTVAVTPVVPGLVLPYPCGDSTSLTIIRYPATSPQEIPLWPNGRWI